MRNALIIALVLGTGCFESDGEGDDTGTKSATGTDTSSDDVSFEVVLSGEAPASEADYGSGADCATLVVEVASSQAALESALSAVGSDIEVPTVSFDENIALVSRLTWCSNGGNELRVDSVGASDGALEVSQIRHHECWGTGELVRPFNVIVLPRMEVESVSGTLSDSVDDTGC